MISLYDMIALLEIAVLTVLMATGLGYFLNRLMGAATLAPSAALACLICLAGAGLGQRLGLLVAVAMVTVLAAGLGYSLFGGWRGLLFFSLMWVAWCTLCFWGYQAGGTPGLILITLPAVALFWAGAFSIAYELLPFSAPPSLADRLRAFRAMLTCSLGRNYPYYAIEKRRATARKAGNVRRLFFAGPGILMINCDQAVVTSDRITIKDVKGPGFSFTGLYETVASVVDLRLQQRFLDVHALTKDGIRINVRPQVSFRIEAGLAWPELGKPFPFNHGAVLSAIQYGQPIEHSQETVGGVKVASRQQRAWDEMVAIVAEQAVRRIIGEYAFDALYAPYDMNKKPHQEIASKLRRQLKTELELIGIQVLGCSIGNMTPVDDEPGRQRVGNWQAEWTRRMAAEMGKGEASYIRMMEAARAQAQVEMIHTISEGVERTGDEEISANVVALSLIEAMEKMIRTPAVQRALPASSAEAVEALRRSIEGQADWE
jgi:hypothetical protein